MTEGQKYKENMVKISKKLWKNNRYAQMLPCNKINIYISSVNFNLALIEEDKDNLEDNYINASYLDGGPIDEENNCFIATQGPLSNTIDKFWKLVISKNVKLILMLCNIEEDFRVKILIEFQLEKVRCILAYR